tara:strand:+ start:346 stop:609 length:264 start_codon:yes stop_codon:yes gene_type:complete
MPKTVRTTQGYFGPKNNPNYPFLPKSIKKQEQKRKKAKKFPDLSGDGKVTKKDILMGRGVIKKKDGGAVRGTARGMGAATKGGGYNV